MSESHVSASTNVTTTPVLISSGLRCVLQFFTAPNSSALDGINHLKGRIISDFTIGEFSIDQIEVPSEEVEKMFASGEVTGGDVSLKFSFDPDQGAAPPLMKPDQGIVYTPQSMLWFGFLTKDKSGLVAYGELPVNVSGFGEVGLPKGQPGTSSMKFKITGEGSKLGKSNVNKIISY
ncbi:MAG: hypothetical protein FWC43_04740 [Planctomycetaceae bacterium]|nr:hypothetical protein [Planctomycetaceae bacterium]